MKNDIKFLMEKKRNGIPITMLTAYNSPTATILDQAGIDAVLIGDSVGTNVLGYKSECEVTISDMIHHVRAVARSVKSAFIVADMPFGTVNNLEEAFDNARVLIASGADCVKVEGWGERKDVIAYLSDRGICVCSHIGYNPQIHGGKGKVFGKDAIQAKKLIDDAKTLEAAGAKLVVIEKVPYEIGARVSKNLSIPVIGIGSGNGCDGQVLVINDILGLGERVFRHAKKYADLRSLAQKAVNDYKNDVLGRVFPAAENTYYMNEDELNKINLQ